MHQMQRFGRLRVASKYVAALGFVIASCISAAAEEQCDPAKFLFDDRSNVVWTEQLKLSFILTSTKEQYDNTRKSWASSGGYGLYYGSLDYDEAKNAASKEAQSRKFDYSQSDYLNYSEQHLSQTGAKAYSDCLDHLQRGPGLSMWVASRDHNIYTIRAIWVGDQKEGQGKERAFSMNNATLIQKPDTWTKGDPKDIVVERRSRDQDARVSMNVSGQTKTVILLADEPEPRKSVVTGKRVIGISSGGSDKQDEWCQLRTDSDCVYPDKDKPNAYLEPGSGHLEEQGSTGGGVGVKILRDTPEEICVQVWASTGDCRVSVSIHGRPAATERYTPVPISSRQQDEKEADSSAPKKKNSRK